MYISWKLIYENNANIFLTKKIHFNLRDNHKYIISYGKKMMGKMSDQEIANDDVHKKRQI